MKITVLNTNKDETNNYGMDLSFSYYYSFNNPLRLCVIVYDHNE